MLLVLIKLKCSNVLLPHSKKKRIVLEFKENISIINILLEERYNIWKESVKKVHRVEKIFANHMPKKDLLFRIHNKLLQAQK